LIKSKKLLIQKKISHGFFNSNGGKSSGVYKSLNCGLGSNDKKSKVKENLAIVKNKISEISKINKKSKNIFLLHQIHSNKFYYIKKKFNPNKKKIKADAIITDQKRLPIAILTADCVPVLLYDNKNDMIGAIHVGWKGAFKGIVRKVINYMVIKGCDKNYITAAIGPCIKQKNYNVKEDFRMKFIKKDRKNKIFFKKKKNVIYFDLTSFY